MRAADALAASESPPARTLEDGTPINAWTKLVLALRRTSLRLDGCVVSTEAHPQYPSPAFATITINHAGLSRTFSWQKSPVPSVRYVNAGGSSGGYVPAAGSAYEPEDMLRRLLAYKPKPRLALAASEAQPHHPEAGTPIGSWYSLVLALRRGSLRLDGCLVSTDENPKTRSPKNATITINHAGVSRTFFLSPFVHSPNEYRVRWRAADGVDGLGGVLAGASGYNSPKRLLKRMLMHKPVPTAQAAVVTAAAEQTSPTGADLVSAFETLWKNLESPFRKRISGDMVTIMRTKSLDIQVSVGGKTLTFMMTANGADRVGVSAVSSAAYRTSNITKNTQKLDIPLTPVYTVQELIQQMLKVVKHGRRT